MVDRATETAVRIGVVGAGAIGRRHVQYCIEEPATVLIGIADSAKEAAALAHESGVAHYRSLENMLDAQRVDGIIVAVPTPLHCKVALTAIRRGIAVLIEKPIAEHPAEVTELIATANSTGAKILVGHHRRHNPVVQQAREIMRSELGRLLAVNVLWAVLKPRSYFEPRWRRTAGAGPVLTNLVHDVDLLRFMCGEIVNVMAAASRSARGHEVEDTVAVLLHFESGALGTITGCDASPSPWSWDANSGENPAILVSRENSYHFLGSDGSLEFPDLHLWRYRVDGEAGWTQPISREGRVVMPQDAYRCQLRHFCRVIDGYEEPLVDAEDARRSLQVTAAILKSAATGQPINPSEIREAA
ncbi:Gfo/Idh/MocA family oxidoreductase [Bradyrhizobium sp. 61]|uniref:Gfo/Idh/MocA family protein n=1 Tax=unclassified Bradyrhizobium TaxID=2631580 RepID=UPI001FF73692|nr:Gfo/Idh/MocA family oxidoreductase [Bradyrhizobium sp. 61]MCK1459729.1 Gfo/Idh/MocA family oxidoreductase [Bradyrhizobium sp. 2]